MSKIHCAIGDVPNGKRRGTQKECLDKGQVRYYGIKHIDKSLIKPKTGKKEKSKDEIKQLELAGQLGAINGKINSLSWKYKQQPNPDKKALLKEEGLKLIAESEIIKKKFDESNRYSWNMSTMNRAKHRFGSGWIGVSNFIGLISVLEFTCYCSPIYCRII